MRTPDRFGIDLVDFVDVLFELSETHKILVAQSAEVLALVEVFCTYGSWLAAELNISEDCMKAIAAWTRRPDHSDYLPLDEMVDKRSVEIWDKRALVHGVYAICTGNLAVLEEVSRLPARSRDFIGNPADVAKRFRAEGLRGKAPKERANPFETATLSPGRTPELAQWFRMWCSRAPHQRGRRTLVAYYASIVRWLEISDPIG